MTLQQRLEEYITAEANDALFYKNLSQIAPTSKEKMMLMQISKDEQNHSTHLSDAYKTMYGRIYMPTVKNVPVTASMYYEILNDRLLDEAADYRKYATEFAETPNANLKAIFFNNMIDENTHALRIINMLAGDTNVIEAEEGRGNTEYKEDTNKVINTVMTSNISCNKNIDLNNNMRSVWEQHVWWTRSLIISIVSKLKDVPNVATRLMQNPGDIANLFKPYYPVEVTNKIQQLFTDHLSIGGDIITAVTNNEIAKAAELDKKWYANADEIAKYFASINPKYDMNKLRDMMYTHLDLTKQELAYYLEGNYDQSISAFDLIEKEALMMADFFTNGLNK